MKRFALLIVPVTLVACTELTPTPAAVPPQVPDADTVRPQSRPSAEEIAARRAPAGARTAEQFDTTTAEERAAAAAPATPPPAASGPLGTTIASLGDPTEQGFWLKTPLVSAITNGRVVYRGNGKAASVELRPSGGQRGSGSQISLAAMRILEAPLTELVELEVYPE